MRNGRHARSKWEWGTPGARSQERAKAARDDPAKKTTPAKKDPDLCKAAHWKGPHAPQIILGADVRHGWKECGWGVPYSYLEYESRWYCRHVRICSGCGKNFGRVTGEECPLYHEVTPSERVALDAEIVRREKQGLAWQEARRKPPVEGPQGYRRRR
jgi:hypothetical protein